MDVKEGARSQIFLQLRCPLERVRQKEVQSGAAHMLISPEAEELEGGSGQPAVLTEEELFAGAGGTYTYDDEDEDEEERTVTQRPHCPWQAVLPHVPLYCGVQNRGMPEQKEPLSCFVQE
jgi:hypothetical protein